ncbi:MAG: hypothetical protein ACKO26_01390 [Planctomycetota bacterium]
MHRINHLNPKGLGFRQHLRFMFAGMDQVVVKALGPKKMAPRLPSFCVVKTMEALMGGFRLDRRIAQIVDHPGQQSHGRMGPLGRPERFRALAGP